MAVYAITDKCNVNCIFCSNEDFNVYYDPPLYRPHTLEELKEYFKKQIPLSEDNITLTGGEPTLRKDLVSILQFITDRYPKATITLLTNGRLFSYKKYCDDFKKFKNLEIEIALNSHKKEIHDACTMCRGSFEQTDKGIKNLLAAGITTNLRIIVTKLNYENLVDSAEYISKNYSGINKIVIIYPRIKGRALEHKNELIVSYGKIMPHLNNALSLLVKKKIGFQLLHFPFCIIVKRYWKNTLKNPYKVVLDACRKCSQYDECPGVSKSYIEYIGQSEFIPLS